MQDDLSAEEMRAWAPQPTPATGPDLRLPGYSGFQLIAQGGEGAVYRARQDGLGRDVAIKALQAVDPATQARFRRELEITVRLGRQHPHIVTVLDTGTLPDGRPCIVMEYYDLGSLHDRLMTYGPLPVAEVVAAGVAVADALAFAHRQGILHRDVKPQNVLVLPTSYVLADFGIARGADAGHSASLQLVSYRHAAPQMLDGATPAAADDLWSLGSTLFTLLMGVPPFAGDTPEEDTVLSYLSRVRSATPRPLTRPDVPPALTEAITRCLSKNREDRHPDATTLHDTLTAIAADLRRWQPTAPTPPPTGPTPSAPTPAAAPPSPTPPPQAPPPLAAPPTAAPSPTSPPAPALPATPQAVATSPTTAPPASTPPPATTIASASTPSATTPPLTAAPPASPPSTTSSPTAVQQEAATSSASPAPSAGSATGPRPLSPSAAASTPAGTADSEPPAPVEPTAVTPGHPAIEGDEATRLPDFGPMPTPTPQPEPPAAVPPPPEPRGTMTGRLADLTVRHGEPVPPEFGPGVGHAEPAGWSDGASWQRGELPTVPKLSPAAIPGFPAMPDPAEPDPAPATGRRWRGFVIAGVVAAVIGVAIGFLATREGVPNTAPTTTPPTTSTAPIPPGGDPAVAPVLTEVDDRGDSAELLWEDPTGGRAQFVIYDVTAADGPPSPITSVAAGLTSFVVTGLDPAASQYCFQVVAIGLDDPATQRGASDRVCVSR